MANPLRYRYSSTEHVSDTTDNLTIKLWDKETGQVFMNRTTRSPREQWYYSPDRFSTDTVGFYDKDNPLSLVYEVGVPPLISYDGKHTYEQEVAGIPNGTMQQTRRVVEMYGTMSHAVHYSEQEKESDVAFITRAVAALNPSRSDFQATVFLAELRDLPSLFKNIGEQFAEQGFLRGSGGAYLSGQYGWRPLISDLKKFFNVADKVQNRVKTLDELSRKGRIRRQFREKDGKGTQIEHFNTRLGYEHYLNIHPTENHVIYCDAQTEMRTTRWADVEFSLDSSLTNLLSSVDLGKLDEARRLVYGTNIDGPSLWAAMPWSWFIDWSTNMSDAIKAKNNVVGASVSKVVLMKTTQRFSTIYPVWDEFPSLSDGFGFNFLPGRLETTVKERILGLEPGAVSTAEPILHSGFRSSILTGLFAQRFKVPGRVNF